MENTAESRAKRIQGYDLARGVAILAMVLIDFKSFFCVDPTFPEWFWALIDYMDRRAAVVLVMVAGAGMTIMSCRSGIKNSRNTLAKRAAFLLLFGLLLSRIWPADILHFYGFFILIGLAMAQLSNAHLLTGAALFWSVGFLGFSDTMCRYLERFGSDSLSGWLADLFFTGFYPVFPWASLYILGMWLGRQNLKNYRITIPLLASGFLLAVLSECARYFIPAMALKAILAHCTCDETAAQIFILLSKLTAMDLALPSPVAIVSGAGTGLCVIMMSFLCAVGLKQGPPQYFLIAGKNTLSLYVLHILVIKAIENLPGMGEDYSLLWVTAGALLFIMAYTSFIRLWLKKFKMGPLESAMRNFPYIRRVPRIVKGHPGASMG
ncbi:heparan-alpha-glucosaminide N-acetyltransferase domain-containing protein [uncultured Desulfobacter sp.]|uniref:heparan-alpha-glucosaminide N-acetyltransferase domain-containing protein n=1 Tax=uncultured Desulfobacter sp. TaxID=240139 RepID=UPI002AABA8C6|nr:heparan-alpha-glucosaminide N-acetyltransferase domain-containing protein [uncultured Desulfobacter sp.]